MPFHSGCSSVSPFRYNGLPYLFMITLQSCQGKEKAYMPNQTIIFEFYNIRDSRVLNYDEKLLGVPFNKRLLDQLFIMACNLTISVNFTKNEPHTLCS